MFWLVEGLEQFERLSSYPRKNTLVIPLWAHDKKHPKFNEVIGVFIYDELIKKPFYVSISHNETISIPIQTIKDWLLEFEIIYTLDKKQFKYFLEHPNVIDSNFELKQKLTNHNNQAIDYFYKLYPYYSYVNQVIPIVKHYERFTSLLEEIKGKYKIEENHFLNNNLTDTLYQLEQSPISYNADISKEMEYGDELLISHDNALYNVYSAYSLTNRVSSILSNKKKQFIIPQNDLLVEFDIRGYHLRLLAKLIGYEFEQDDIHSHFAELYKVDYERSKHITFNMMYGGVKEEYLHLEFFNRVNNFTEIIWEEYQSKGFVEMRHGVKISNITEAKPAKVLNYYLQNLETYTNIIILQQIFEILENKKTTLINVNFDSFLFDVSREEKQILSQVDGVFEKLSLKTKIKHGFTYNF